jgi:hypothetical protein
MRGHAAMARARSMALAALYAELNAKFWDGQLPPTIHPEVQAPGLMAVQVSQIYWANLDLLLRDCSRPLGDQGGPSRGAFIDRGLWAPSAIYVISGLLPEEEREVLLHEMCHCAVSQHGTEALAHGPRFLAQLERIREPWAQDQCALRWLALSRLVEHNAEARALLSE